MKDRGRHYLSSKPLSQETSLFAMAGRLEGLISLPSPSSSASPSTYCSSTTVKRLLSRTGSTGTRGKLQDQSPAIQAVPSHGQTLLHHITLPPVWSQTRTEAQADLRAPHARGDLETQKKRGLQLSELIHNDFYSTE